MVLRCFDFLLCFSRELGRSRRSRCSRAFVKAVNELLHTQFQWVLTGRWLIQKLEKSLSSLRSKILIQRCGCLYATHCDHASMFRWHMNKNQICWFVSSFRHVVSLWLCLWFIKHKFFNYITSQMINCQIGIQRTIFFSWKVLYDEFEYLIVQQKMNEIFEKNIRKFCIN